MGGKAYWNVGKKSRKNNDWREYRAKAEMKSERWDWESRNHIGSFR